jgi:hypothetical protein
VRSTCRPSDSDIEPPKYTRSLDGLDRPFSPLAEVLGKLGRPRHDVVERHDIVNRPVGQSLRRRERLALEDRDERLVSADQPRQPLTAAAARHDPKQDFRLTDEEVAVGHHAQVARPCEFRAKT